MCLVSVINHTFGALLLLQSVAAHTDLWVWPCKGTRWNAYKGMYILGHLTPGINRLAIKEWLTVPFLNPKSWSHESWFEVNKPIKQTWNTFFLCKGTFDSLRQIHVERLRLGYKKPILCPAMPPSLGKIPLATIHTVEQLYTTNKEGWRSWQTFLLLDFQLN